MKSYKNIACIAFGNEKIVLNSYAYEKKKQSLTSEFIEKHVTPVAL